MIPYTLGRTKFKLKILYKSGNSHSMWVYNFNIKGSEVHWYPVTSTNKPILFNYEEVEAIYQVGYKSTIWPFYSPL